MKIKQTDTDLGLGKLVKNVNSLKGKKVSVKYGAFTQKSANKLVKFEYGGFYDGNWHGFVPARPVLAPEYAKNLPQYVEAGKEFNDNLIDKGNVLDVANAVGEKGKKNLLTRIKSLNYDSTIKPLHPATIAKKGHDTIGKDTGDMMNDISYVVSIKTGKIED